MMDLYNVDLDNMSDEELELFESKMDRWQNDEVLLDGPGCLNERAGIFQCEYCEQVFNIYFMAIGTVVGHACCKVCNFRETM